MPLMPDRSLPMTTVGTTEPVRIPTGGRHTLQVARRHVRATRIDASREPAPGQTVTFTAAAGDSFQVTNGDVVNGSRRSASAVELRRLRWRVHCGGQILADTPLREGSLTLQLPQRMVGESLLAAAYTWEPFVHIFSHWWLPGRPPKGTGTVRSAQQLADVIRACGRPVPADLDGLYRYLQTPFSAGALGTTLQQAHFLAQAIHESIGMSDLEENIAPDEAGRKYAHKNGNSGAEDGAAFIGRGILQITGFNAYRSVFVSQLGEARYRQTLGREDERAWLRRNARRVATEPALAVQAGLHFWATKPVADRAALDDVLGTSIRVNGWEGPGRLPINYTERVRFTEIVKAQLGLRR